MTRQRKSGAVILASFRDFSTASLVRGVSERKNPHAFGLFIVSADVELPQGS